MKPSLRRVFDIDLRSLAALRIAVAGVALADLAVRATDLGVHYSDAGALPRRDLLEAFATWHDFAFSVHLLGGAVWTQAVLFALHAACLVALLLGWRTRTATALAWLLTASLHLRNPLLVYGADSLLRMLLLWGVLLPLGARWSVDALRGGSSPSPSAEGSARAGVCSTLAGVGVQVQVFLVVFIAGIAKVATDFWVAGEGLARAFDHEMHTRTAGLWLQGFPELTSALSWAVIVLETAGAVLLFAPWARVRVVVLIAMGAMFAGIEMTMRVGFFPLATSAALLVFVPGSVWDVLERRLHGGRLAERRSSASAWMAGVGAGPHASGFSTLRSRQRVRRAIGAVCSALLIAYTLQWNVGLWRSAQYEPPPLLAPFGKSLALWQKWGMFTELAETGWISIPGDLADGRRVELFADRGRVPALDDAIAAAASREERPAHVADDFRNVHWLSMFHNMTMAGEEAAPFLPYGRFLCREWNRTHEGPDALRSFEIHYRVRPIAAQPGERSTSEYARRVLWIHDCFG